ncbi:GNAT family N-acetyltransferase [Paenibacillus allorhizosphaerae]|uniref:Spermidine N(1)-acetyltransferase n=1 Tax=Paenibacillus allorhizosphaerae TaxID=2849866 RepID=A0ABM8VG48_9BACL|nr:GNAT family protein [Paenibacillus allorhizosphaerae]CAG7637068.1 Spermidine N(1)-acetyltransferase [Paenibacillus allorhizosphaerae]
MALLTGSRIYLREFKFTDWVDVHAYASQEIVCRFQPWGPNNEEQTQAFVKQIIDDANKASRTRFVFAIVELGSEKLIGAGEINIRSASNRSGEIAYIVHPDYWGKGIATEAVGLLVKYGFSEFRLHRIYATCDPRNIGSSQVLTNIGMTQEGRMRDTLLLRDGWRDSLVFSILEQEWERLSS